MSDPATARERLAGYLQRRVAAVVAACRGEATLMLSGGIDSVLLAAAWRKFAEPPLCVTVAAAGIPSGDREQAAAAAAHLGLEHHTVELTTAEIRRLARRAVALLGVDEMWEIGAAIPIMSAAAAAREAGRNGPIISGAGADVLFAGGMRLVAPAVSRAAAEELRSRVWAELGSAFRYDRLVPDFFDRILGADAKRFFEVFQTVEAWELTADFAPSVLFAQAADGTLVDKLCLRELAVEWGAEPTLAWAPKNPMQFSSGMIDAFSLQARAMIETDAVQHYYTDPRNEPDSTLMARLWLRHLSGPEPEHPALAETPE